VLARLESNAIIEAARRDAEVVSQTAAVMMRRARHLPGTAPQ
jgi:hypothetical protein